MKKNSKKKTKLNKEEVEKASGGLFIIVMDSDEDENKKIGEKGKQGIC